MYLLLSFDILFFFLCLRIISHHIAQYSYNFSLFVIHVKLSTQKNRYKCVRPSTVQSSICHFGAIRKCYSLVSGDAFKPIQPHTVRVLSSNKSTYNCCCNAWTIMKSAAGLFESATRLMTKRCDKSAVLLPHQCTFFALFRWQTTRVAESM